MTKIEMVFKDKDDYLVVFMPTVLDKLFSYRQLQPHNHEAGGVLIGERRGQHIVIFDLSEPGPGDKSTRYSFDRNGKHHQEKVNEAHNLSSGTMQYIGEWHTHPEDHPRPSAIDRNSWKTHLRASEPMVLAIVGRQSIWGAKKIGGSILRMNIEES